MNYEKILCEFQNFIKAYLSLEHKHDEEHKKIENDLRIIFKKYDCIFFEQLSELMSDIISTWEEYDGM